MNAILSLRDVSREFRGRGRVVAALDRVSLDLAAGEFLTVVGPSGCGKSTLLNVVSGLLPVSGGEILYKGAPLAGVNPEIGYVTQADNLYPWRTLRGNVEFPLEVRGVPRAERRARSRPHRARRTRRLRGPLSLRANRWDAAAGEHRAHARLRSRRHPDGRAVRPPRRADAPHPPG